MEVVDDSKHEKFPIKAGFTISQDNDQPDSIVVDYEISTGVKKQKRFVSLGEVSKFVTSFAHVRKSVKFTTGVVTVRLPGYGED
ncbi:MAG: hypothetical protein ACFFD4_02415 [Candidatus Odinarchaeota archaeon]